MWRRPRVPTVGCRACGVTVPDVLQNHREDRELSFSTETVRSTRKVTPCSPSVRANYPTTVLSGRLIVTSVPQRTLHAASWSVAGPRRTSNATREPSFHQLRNVRRHRLKVEMTSASLTT